MNSSYLIIRGLAFQGGSTGVRFRGGHHITLEDSEIYETGNNAVSLNYGNSDFFIFRGNVFGYAQSTSNLFLRGIVPVQHLCGSHLGRSFGDVR